MRVYLASVIAFLITAALVLALRPMAQAAGLVDRPGGRKSHSGEIPVVGGLAMFGGCVVAAVMGGGLTPHGSMLLVASAFMVVIGALDDRFDLEPQFRLFAHAAAAIALTYGTDFVVADLGDLLGNGTIRLGWLAVPFTVIACMALITALNMLDGLDGLAGGCAMIAFAGLAIVATGHDAPTSAVISLGLMGSCLGFLMFNVPARFNRGVRTFMGDAGSTLLGFVLASVSLFLIQPDRADIPPVFILWMMPIPIFELFSSTVRRISRGMSPLRADSGHFHYVLVQSGFSVRLVFAIYLLVSATSVGFGIAALEAGVPEPVMFWLFAGFFGAWVLVNRAAPVIGTLLPRRLRRDLENLQH